MERAPEDVVLPPRETLRQAQRLLDDGYPFHAHEILEAAWKSASGDERDLWQGLAQVAVGLTHIQRDNPTGAVSLLRRGGERIRDYRPHPPHGLDAVGLVRYVDELVARIGERGLAGLTEADQRPLLCRPDG